MSESNEQINKQEQLKINRSLLSSLNQQYPSQPVYSSFQPTILKPPFEQQNAPQMIPQPQIFQAVQPGLPLFQMIPSGQLIPVQTYVVSNQAYPYRNDEENLLKANLSYNSAININNSNNSDFENEIALPKRPSTSMSFCRTSNDTFNEFYLKKKTKRNKIIINEENPNYFSDIYNNNYANNYSAINNNYNALNNNYYYPNLNACNEANKNHSAPVRLLSFEEKKFAENYLNSLGNIKSKIENNLENNMRKMNNDILEDAEEIKIGESKLFPCEHCGCELVYKTKKQLIAHHYKKNPECQKDSIQILQMISKCKGIINNLIKEKKVDEEGESFKQLEKQFQEKLNSFSNTDYTLLICGTKLKVDENERYNSSKQ